MRVKELMSSRPEYLSPDVSLQEASRIMMEDDIGFIPIGEGDRLIGVVTDRDICVRGVARALNPVTTPVRNIMTQKVLYCFENDEIKLVAKRMEAAQIRRMVVLNSKKRLVGVLSMADIATKTHDEYLSGEILDFISRKAA